MIDEIINDTCDTCGEFPSEETGTYAPIIEIKHLGKSFGTHEEKK